MTMTVRQMIEWMSTFEDQDAIVEVICYDTYEGTCQTEEFDPDAHVTYTDMRGNQFVRETDSYYNRRSVLFGID
jgi:hypothetical protein